MKAMLPIHVGGILFSLCFYRRVFALALCIGRDGGGGIHGYKGERGIRLSPFPQSSHASLLLSSTLPFNPLDPCFQRSNGGTFGEAAKPTLLQGEPSSDLQPVRIIKQIESESDIPRELLPSPCICGRSDL